MAENKFDFTEDETPNQNIEESKEAIKQDAKGLFESIKIYLVELLDFRGDTDREATIKAIEGDIPFKGATAWILICSIFVASIGLNADSTAVVIGAMLISPLMGPILGVGMSIAINDIDTLRKSLINLATMIALSLATAFLFFWLFPLSEDTSELLGRTRPDIRDVLIAFFGGLALIIARTKKGTIASVIFGVAIATALMPPLCTAGYGLSQSNWKYFGGAMYLFTINTIFIALATYIVLKVLRFPMLKYANSKRRRFISRVATLLAIVVMVPAVWTFINVLKESRYKLDYKKYLNNEVLSNDDLWLHRNDLDIDKKTIKLFFNGEISEATDTDLRNELRNYENLKDFELVIDGNKNRSVDLIMDLYDNAITNLQQKDSIIYVLQKDVDSLKMQLQNVNNILDASRFNNLSKDAKIKFPDLTYFGFAKRLQSSDFKSFDTISVVTVKWNTQLNDSTVSVKDGELKKWIKQELGSSKIEVSH